MTFGTALVVDDDTASPITTPCSDCITDTFSRAREAGTWIGPPDTGPDYLAVRQVEDGVDVAVRDSVHDGALYLPFAALDALDSIGVIQSVHEIDLQPGVRCRDSSWYIDIDIDGMDVGGLTAGSGGGVGDVDEVLFFVVGATQVGFGYANWHDAVWSWAVGDVSGSNYAEWPFGTLLDGRFHARLTIAGGTAELRVWLPDSGETIDDALSIYHAIASGDHTVFLQWLRRARDTANTSGIGTSGRVLSLNVTGC
jgi:hypothetical protein